MCFELFLTLPGCPFQVIMLERMNEDFSLVQPRGVGWRVAGFPPPLVLSKIPLRFAPDVTWPTILDQEDAPQFLVVLVKELQFG